MNWIKARMVWDKTVGQPLIAAAVVLILIAVWLAITDRVAAGTLVAALFVVVALFHLLPQMESFKAFGVEAKWRERLKEADEILRKLRASTLASAQLTYYTLGWGSRFGGETTKRKQQIADQVDAVLADLGIERDDLVALRRDYLFFAKLDIFQFFEAIVALRIKAVQHQTSQRMTELSKDPENSEFKDLSEKSEKLRRPREQPDLMEELQRVEFREFCYSRIPINALSPDDVNALKRLAERVAEIVEACNKTGRVTGKAAELIEGYRPEDRTKTYRELFNEEPVA